MNEITYLIISILSISYTHTSPLDEVLSKIIKVVLGRKEDLQQDVSKVFKANKLAKIYYFFPGKI